MKADLENVLSRPYLGRDLADCLALFDSNLPKFFAPEERDEFEADLSALPLPASPFLVLTLAEKVVACGGLTLGPGADEASLSWGMVDRTLQGQGLGTRLVTERLALVRGQPALKRLHLSTSQHTRGFYEGFGFAVTRIIENGYGPGIDRCDMVLRLGQ